MGIIHGTQPLDFYEAVSDSNNNTETYAVTVIRGEETGEKAVISGGELFWCSSADGFLGKHLNELSDISESGILALDGREIFVELLGNDKHAVICGAGHLSIPLIRILRMMGMKTTVIDDREEFAENAGKAGADKVICKSFADGMAEVEGNEDTFFVVVTRGHRYDRDCVGAALLKKHAYVGMIGSKRHAFFVREALREEGISEELIDSIYTPIGLSIGAETPEEIAVAIAAELIEVKNRKRRNFGFPADILKEIRSDRREPMILATIVSREGSAPRGIGTKMLVRKDGSIVGTIGGGSAEGRIMKEAVGLLEDGFSGTMVSHEDLACFANEDGMVCGGRIDVLLETV